MFTSLRLAIALLGLALSSVAQPAGAQALQPWPGKPVRIVVPYPPGGTTDIIARILADHLKDEFGQPFIVDNKPGAGTMLGAQIVASAPPDGTTLLLVTVSTMAINPVLLKKMPYRPEQLVPIALIAKAPFVLVASPSFPPNTVKDMVAYARAHPDKVNLAGQGTGASSHLVGEMFKAAADLPGLTIVQYKGSAPANSDAMVGNVQMHFDGSSTSLPLVHQKRLKALAITSETRIATAPDVPTFVESGYPSMVASAWYGLVAPADTPASVIEQLNVATNRALATPQFQGRLVADGAIPGGGSVADFAKFVDSEIANWRRVVAPLKIDLD